MYMYNLNVCTIMICEIIIINYWNEKQIVCFQLYQGAFNYDISIVF